MRKHLSVVVDDKHGRDRRMLIYWQGLTGQKASVGCVKFKSNPVPTEKIVRKINISSIGVNCSAKLKHSLGADGHPNITRLTLNIHSIIDNYIIPVTKEYGT